ncbi:MAG: RecQ family ATP-dependent DNA helicase [Acidimicrobiia bacterium]
MTYDRALELLRSATGSNVAEFRGGQWESIEAVVVGRRRVLVVQRTGWGKSAVYFVATRLLREAGMGPTVVVSPLLALMRNQIEMAARLGLSAKTVNSTNRDDWDAIFVEIAEGRVDVLFISPERLNNPEFRSEVLPDLLKSLGLLVVDEVHCISDWGHDFRPDYRRLANVVALLPPGVAVLGTTATANDRVVSDVREQLGENLMVVRGPLDRTSLRLQIVGLESPADRLAWLAGTIPGLAGSGIVYTLTIKGAQRVARWLRSQGVDAVAYSSETPDEERIDIERRLSDGSLKVVVATSALGMGYDNPFIQFVIHYQSPGSPVAYYQQVGRAGRAVDSAIGILMTGSEDADIQDYFIRTAFPTEEHVAEILGALDGADGLTVRQLEQVNIPAARLAGALKVLEVEGAVYREGSRWYRSAERYQYPRERVAAVTAQRRAEQAIMREIIEGDGCILHQLRLSLDDDSSAPCGRCSNCVGEVLPVAVPGGLAQAAVDFIRGESTTIEPRKRWPFPINGTTTIGRPFAEGRALTRWGDPGLAALVERGKYRDGSFSDDLVIAAVESIRRWSPRPAPEWVTSVPGLASGDLVGDFAVRLADRLRLPYLPAVRKLRVNRPQKTMENSTRQVKNLLGVFEVVSPCAGPVLLVDDMVDSRWTLTVVGDLLGRSGVSHVYPLALADTSRGSG